MQNELKPCPFCGGEAHLIAPNRPMSDGKYMTWAACDTCGTMQRSSRGDTAEKVIIDSTAAWNQRVTDNGLTNDQINTEIDSRDCSEYDQRQGVPND